MVDVVYKGRVVQRAHRGGGIELQRGLRDLDLLRDRVNLNPKPTLPCPIDIRYELLAGNLSGFLVVKKGIVTTDTFGAFSISITINSRDRLKPGVLSAFKFEPFLPEGRGGLVQRNALMLFKNLPPGPPHVPERLRFILNWRSTVSEIEVPVDTRGLSPFLFQVTTPPDIDDGAFTNIKDAVVEFLNDENKQIGVAPLLGDSDERSANILIETGAEADPIWFRIHQSANLRFTSSFLPIPLCRSQLHTQDGNATSHKPRITRIRKVLTLGDLSSQIPEEGRIDDHFVFRRLVVQLKKIDGAEPFLLRIRADIGVGWTGADGNFFMLMQVGTFTGFYGLGLTTPPTRPFDPNESDSMIVVNPLSSSLDLLPETDVDELDVFESFQSLEAKIGFHMLVNAASLIAKAANKKIKSSFNKIKNKTVEAIPPGASLSIASVLGGLFFQVNSIKTGKDDITIIARGGVWSSVVPD